MANSLANYVPTILAMGLEALRNFNVMPRLVNSDFGTQAAMKGDTITLPIPSSIAARAVAPAVTPVASPDLTDAVSTIALDQWYEAPFHLTDKQILEVEAGVVPAHVTEAVAALADNVNAYILGKYTGVYGYVGTAATTPFASTIADATNARKTLNAQKARLVNRRMVLDTDAAENLLALSVFHQANTRGDGGETLREGTLGRAMGFDIAEDQQVVSHTNGGGAGWLVNDASHAAGAKTLTIDTGTGDPAAGDIFTVAGDTQTYVVVSYASNVITHEPAGKVALADNAAITFKATHVVNLAFHRDAFGFASRPLSSASSGMGSIIETAVDPVSGISLRLELSRQHKQDNWSFDILYGANLVRRELAARIAG